MTTAAPDPVLKVERLSMRFGGLTAVDDVSFDVGRGDITALIGPNGAGKTTVFNCITGFYKPTRGRLTLRRSAKTTDESIERATRQGLKISGEPGQEAYLLERLADHEIARLAGVARTFQNIRLFSGMTVLENLVVAQHNALASPILPFLPARALHGRSSRSAVDLASDWLKRIGLLSRADEPAGSLPYGDQRRLEIARAMCTGPSLLCLDEPAAGLNPRESSELAELLRSIRDDLGTSVFLIEHDMSVVMNISDHVIVLEYGRKIADGAAPNVRDDPAVIAAYLGVADEEDDPPDEREAGGSLEERA